MASPAPLPAVHHVAVTVSDLASSEAWYTRVLGTQPVLSEDTGPFHHIVYAIGGTLLGLHGFPDLATSEAFDERRPGLDHIGFGVASRDDLEEAVRLFDSRGVRHGEITRLGSFGIDVLPFEDPDGVQLELTAPVAPAGEG